MPAHTLFERGRAEKTGKLPFYRYFPARLFQLSETSSNNLPHTKLIKIFYINQIYNDVL
jgi:hypothetical protein